VWGSGGDTIGRKGWPGMAWNPHGCVTEAWTQRGSLRGKPGDNGEDSKLHGRDRF
jgi:hypothetical protein